jgi:hypothetical protein
MNNISCLSFLINKLSPLITRSFYDKNYGGGPKKSSFFDGGVVAAAVSV